MKKVIGISLSCLVALLVVLPGCTAATPWHVVIARTETLPEIVYVETGAAGGGDHGALTGLGDDDHPQYILNTLFDADTFLYATLDDTPVATSPTNALAALSGHAGAEFLFNTQQVGGVVDPTANQQVATKKYVDDNDVDATKECWFPVTRADDMNQTMSLPGGYINAAGERAWMPFYFPRDFGSVTEAVVLVNPLTTATHRFDLYSDYAANGEAYTTNSESDLNHDYSLIALQLYEIDVSGLLSTPVAGDYGGIRLHGDATNTPDALVIGLRIKYE